jgi:hypothetical protein
MATVITIKKKHGPTVTRPLKRQQPAKAKQQPAVAATGVSEASAGELGLYYADVPVELARPLAVGVTLAQLWTNLNDRNDRYRLVIQLASQPAPGPGEELLVATDVSPIFETPPRGLVARPLTRPYVADTFPYSRAFMDSFAAMYRRLADLVVERGLKCPSRSEQDKRLKLIYIITWRWIL